MIAARSLTKRYGTATAVDNVSFDVAPGVVTGFLGPNGSGKSTTMRMVMGLDFPDSGSVLIGGKLYSELAWPLRAVGGLLDAKAFHPARTARNHLRWLALTNDIPPRRVDEVLDQVGLSSVANRRVGKFSLGMSQRLGIAAAFWATRVCCCSMSRSTAWTRRVSAGPPLPPGSGCGGADRVRVQPSNQRDVPDR
jgi:ABC-2 type transport system ATP-binding protein